MEIIKESGVDSSRRTLRLRNRYLGVLLVGVGLLWLLDNFGLVGARLFRIVFSWQMLLVLIGGYLCVVKRYWAGVTVAAVGIVFGLTDHFGVCIPVRRVVLPVAVIAVGAGLVIASLRRKGY